MISLSRRLFPIVSRIRMSSTFKQAPHKLLVIPGPIEVADEVLYANAHPSMSHVSPDFIPYFGDSIRMIREVLVTKNAQPFLISGSGTLGWDQVGANLIEPGDNALVLHTGYFGDSFTECLETYGASVTQLKAPIGSTVPLSTIEAALLSPPNKTPYKILTLTHVDTSTAVLSPAADIAALVRRVSPGTLVVMDAVCSVASELILFDKWGLDVVLTASQKGLGAPPGLSILLASPRALAVWEERTKQRKEGGYYVSWGKWLPIMRAYEEGRGAYFATPPVNLIYAFHASLCLITGRETFKPLPPSTPSEEEEEAQPPASLLHRLALHTKHSSTLKSTALSLGFTPLPTHPSIAANGMTALYFPPNSPITGATLLPKLGAKGVVVAGGLHKDIKDKYFRIGHMGVSVVGRGGLGGDEEDGQGENDVEKVGRVLSEVVEEINEEDRKRKAGADS